MTENTSFPPNGFGKPYGVPEGFFEHLPQQTLELAKRRRERRARNRRMALMLSSAAVVLLLLAVVPPNRWRAKASSENVEQVLHDFSDADLNHLTTVYGSDLMDEQLTNENSY